MKTMIDGIEITPEMVEVLKKWYNTKSPEDIEPRIYVRWLGKIQDYLTRIWVNMDDDEENVAEFKECVNCLIVIKDDLNRFIPEKGDEA